MQKSDHRSALNVISNQPIRQRNDLLAKIRPKSDVVQHRVESETIQISSGLKTSNTRIEHNINPSYEPLVSISDNDHSDDDNYVTPVHKLTQSELREELQTFQSHNDNDNDDDDAGDLEFRTQQPGKRSNCCLCFIS